MSSEYEFHANLSANQLQKQRDRRHKRIVEILNEKSRTELSFADYIRYEILDGTTHHLKKYKKLGERYGFDGSYSYPKVTGWQEDIKQYMIDDGAVHASEIAEFTKMKFGIINATVQSLAQLSQGPEQLIHYEHYSSGGNESLGNVQHDDRTWDIDEYIVKESNNHLELSLFQDYTDDDGELQHKEEIWDTDLPAGSSQTTDKIGFACEYTIDDDSDISYGFFSNDEKYIKIRDTEANPYELMPCISLKDDGNDEQPYYKLEEDDPQYIMRKKILKAININFKDISKKIFEIEDIPDTNTDEWKKHFGKEYAHNKTLQAEYGSEDAYHDYLVEVHDNQQENSGQLSDAHIGFFATPKFLDETSAAAAVYSMLPILQGLTEASTIKLQSGTLKQEWAYRGVRVVIKEGTPRNIYDPDDLTRGHKNKASWYIKSYSKAKNEDDEYIHDEDYYTEVGLGGDDDDTILETLIEFGSLDDDDSGVREWKNIFELRLFQPDNDGNPRYIEIRIKGFMATSVVTQLHNPDYPDGAIRTIATLDLCDITDEDLFVNGILIPLTWDAIRQISIFKRDRLSRETLCIVTQGIAVTEIPWYATTLFKIFMLVLVVVATIIFAPAGQVGAALLSLAEGIAVSYALQLLAKYIKSPILMAIITFTVGIIFAGGALSALDMLSLAVEATGTYINQTIMLKHLEMQKKEEDFKNLQNKHRAQLKKLEEEFGLNKKSNTAYILYLASLPPVEHPDDFFGRALNTNLNDISASLELQ